MSGQYICFIKIYDFKFDIVVTQDKTSPLKQTFYEISDKISQILKIALDKDIDVDGKSHLFELVDSSSDERSIIKSFDDEINHLSAILIRDKPLPLSRGRAFINDPDVIFLDRRSRDIKAFGLMIDCFNHSWNFKNNADKKWLYICQRLIEKDQTFSKHTPRKCCQTVIELISYYCRAFDKLNLKLDPELQKKFDVLKLIHLFKGKNLFTNKIATDLKRIEQNIEIQDYLRFGFDIYETKIRGAKRKMTLTQYKDICSDNTIPKAAEGKSSDKVIKNGIKKTDKRHKKDKQNIEVIDLD